MMHAQRRQCGEFVCVLGEVVVVFVSAVVFVSVVVVVGVGDGGGDAAASDAMVAIVAIGDCDVLICDESASDADAIDSDAMCAVVCPLGTWRCAAARHAGLISLPAAN